MKLSYILVVAFLCISHSYSQDLINTETLVTSNTGLIYTFDRSDKTIQGTPYINETFSLARVSADQSKIYSVRYNAVSDEIEVETEENTIYAINKKIKNVTITFIKSDKTYQAITYVNDDGDSKTGYFIFLSNMNAPIKLLLKEAKMFIDRKPAKSSYQEAKPAHFKRLKDQYYVVINDNVQTLSTNKKDIAKLFPEHSKAILDYIKTNKIKTSKEVDLITLINYINTL